MDRDVEMRLSTELAAFRANFDGFAKDSQRRWDEAVEKLSEIDTQVRQTNGRVTKLEAINIGRDAVAAASIAPRPINLADIKLYVAIAIGSGTMAVGTVLWVLRVVGTL